MKEITIHGNLGSNPEQKTIGGSTVTSFSVAVNDRDETTWFRANVWGKPGDAAAKYLRKGSEVIVRGDLRAGTYQSNNETRLSLDIQNARVKFCGKKSSDVGPETQSTQTSGGDDSGIPF